jgi:hypothetical protein
MKAYLLLCLLSAAPLAEAQEPAADEASKLPPMREVQPGVLEIGPIRIDKNARSVSFPGR